MVTVQFNFKSILEAQEFLAAQMQQIPRATNPTATEVTALLSEAAKSGPDGSSLLQQVVDAHLPSTSAPEPEKKKRGPKPKAVPVKEYGIEDCRIALSNLFDVKGREAAKAVLTEFKVARIGELTADQFSSFINACEADSRPE